MPTLETPLGSITAMEGAEFYGTGALRSCIAIDESPLLTGYGTLIPQFSSNSVRKRQLPSLSFHENGMPRTLPLEEQVTITTPLGVLPAEKVTFYPDGAVKRIFPLNGCLSGYWELKDEIRLASPLNIDTPCGPMKKRLISLYFGPHGNLKSLTFWPGERIKVKAPLGPISVRVGLAFYDSGQIKSLEPAVPVAIKTPIGEVVAFDPDALGITGDQNSLRFDEAGNIMSLVTVSSSFNITTPDKTIRKIESPTRLNPVDGETREPTPMTVTFKEGKTFFSASGMAEFSAPYAAIQTKGLLPLFG